MIKRLDNKVDSTASEIHSVFQASYAIEAKLLNAIDFPPLQRSVSDFLVSQTDFYGFLKNEELAGVVELDTGENTTHIQSLVVHPSHFRQGIARQLVQFVLDSNNENFMVETGYANEPAIRLYKSFGFVETKQWDTDHGVRKVKFELVISS